MRKSFFIISMAFAAAVAFSPKAVKANDILQIKFCENKFLDCTSVLLQNTLSADIRRLCAILQNQKFPNIAFPENCFPNESESTTEVITEVVPEITTEKTTEVETYTTPAAEQETTKRYPIEWETTKRYPTEQETTKRYPIEQETTKRYPIEWETTKRYPIENETTKRYPIEPETTKRPSAGATTPDDNISQGRTYAEQVVDLVNKERAKAGLNKVTLNKKIESAALTRAYEIEKSFSHTRPNGTSFSTVLREHNISYRGSGENIAWGQSSPEAVMNAWMNSSGHRANILNPNFREMGVGYYKNSTGRKHWTQLFVY